MGQDNNGAAGLPLRGSGFNTDPQAGDWDSLVYEGHSLIERVRGENTDTDDAFAIYVQGVSQTTKVFNVLKTGAIYVGSTNTAVLSATSGITLASTAAAGSGLAALRYDATIRAFQAVNPLPVGSVASYGSSSLASRDDHAHLGVTSIAASGNSALSGVFRLYAGAGVGLTQIADGVQIMASTAVPAGASAGTPALVLGTTNAAGGTNFIGVSSTVMLYDSTAPAAMTIGGVAVQGGGSFAARSNHGHAIAATNVSLSGGSWGSGPIFDNPQIAATGWASANHAHLAGNSGGTLSAAAISYVTASATTNVTMTSAATYYDAAAIVLSVGTWILSAHITFQIDGASSNDYIRIYDSTNAVVVGSAETVNAAASNPDEAVVTNTPYVVASGTPTVKAQLSRSLGTNTSVILAASNGNGNNASRITAFKVA